MSMNTSGSPHVLIIGAGMAGLTFAHQLRKRNISFEVFERDADNDARQQGWALSLFGQALHDLSTEMPADLGPLDQVNHLLPLDIPAQFVFYDITRPQQRVGVVSDDSGKIIRANRQRLRDYLLQNLPVKFGKRLMKIEESNDKVTVHFQDGTSATGDYLVGAEGTRSTVREHLLKGKDVIAPLPLGSIVGEVELSNEEFAEQLSLAHSGYIIMNSTLGADKQNAVFAALNKVSPDGKTGFWYFLYLWVDREAPFTSEEKPGWTVNATQQQLADFAREGTKMYPDHLRKIIDRVPVEGYRSPGFQLQGVEIAKEQLPIGKVMIIGDAAHSMTPFRGEAGVCAFTDAMKLGRLFGRIQDEQLKTEQINELLTEFRDDMLARGKWAIDVSNPVLEDYGRHENYEFGTFGKIAAPLAPETVTV